MAVRETKETAKETMTDKRDRKRQQNTANDRKDALALGIGRGNT